MAERSAGDTRIFRLAHAYPELGDGPPFVRRGKVLAMHGEDLMKFAPLLGDVLAGACVDGMTPAPPEADAHGASASSLGKRMGLSR
ncbi:hypothetical protein [Actinoplanes sp. NPDC020271]|uniref:hypothetical protein n=1 Tax=Actinoplanes sp. NPDC020271 TaxID=3363896 RepID=UPI00378A47DB